ncbi:MAG: type VI secretion system baseplate subunit TssE [Desulforegulaceae bacterium]|jgi:type VI secretion system protein|nr:type VI secretion system baseplate subunit TssE [Desulforegulaceae bacterium]
MSGITLLEKLDEYEKNPQKRGAWDSLKIKESVLNSLSKILNSRQGGSLSAPDFGMPDFTNIPGFIDLETYTDFEQSIKKVIEKYEPRIKNLNVEYIKAEKRFFLLKFKLEGNIVLPDFVIPLSIQTVIEPEGKIIIKN